MDNLKTSKSRKRKASTPAEPPIPELSDEIVLNILVRLPVKTVLRCRAVCKAWLAIISDSSFTRAHLRCSASRCEQNPRFIITPHTLDHVPWEDLPTTFSNHIRFYQWQQGAPMATLMHDEDFGSQFGTVRYFAHCGWAAPRCYCDGLGLDPHMGKYKVVRAFYRSKDPHTNLGRNMGMEHHHRPPPRGLLHLSLADETYGITKLPASVVDPVLPNAFSLDELHGELYVTELTNYETTIIWTVPILEEDGGKGRRARTWKNLFFFNIHRYTESLVRISV
uniref:F-box domain-containing protein n=1 Tax=Setaria italica TaxID=4555 RepID=K3YYV2_SETIT